MALYKIDKDAQGQPTGDLDLIAGGTLWADAPIGTIFPFLSSSIPAGFLLCDGTAYPAASYPELWAILPSTVKNTTNNTFTIDLRETTLKGAGLTGETVDAHLDADGLAVGEFLDDRLQNHRHNAAYQAQSGGTGEIQSGQVVGDNNYMTGYVREGRSGATTEVKSRGVNFIIKAKMVALPADFLAKVDEAVEEMCTDTVTSGSTAPITSGGVYNALAYTPTNNPSASLSLRGTSVTFKANTNTDLPAYNTGAGTLYIALSGLGSYKIDISFNSNQINKLTNGIGVTDVTVSVSNGVGTITSSHFTMTLTRVTNAIRINCTNKSGKAILNYMWI